MVMAFTKWMPAPDRTFVNAKPWVNMQINKSLGQLARNVIFTSMILLFSLVQSSTTRAQAGTASVGVVEFSLDAPLPLALTAGSVQATLVRTIDTSQFSPPSPDPTGIAYLPTVNTLLIGDSEVEEMPDLFTGDNLFEATLSGSLVNTSSTTNFSNEPTGVAFDNSNAHVFFSDDGSDRIFEVNPGADGRYGTADDIVTSFDTRAFGSNDPEGVAFDSQQRRLFIADAANEEVYRVSPGANGIFDGLPPAGDDMVAQFDTEVLGLQAPQGIAFDPLTRHLYLVGLPTTAVAEVTIAGKLVQMIDISAANAHRPAGLTLGPGTLDPLGRSLYIVDRGVDNDTNPDENDGKLYEFSLPRPIVTFLPVIIHQ